MSCVEQLFKLATTGQAKADRHSAFRQLRELALRGQGPEADEAREALEHSAEYQKKLEAA